MIFEALSTLNEPNDSLFMPTIAMLCILQISNNLQSFFKYKPVMSNIFYYLLLVIIQ